MTVFRDNEAAERTMDRLHALTGLELDADFQACFDSATDPDLAIINLERWLKAVSNPGTQLALLLQMPRFLRLLIELLGASQPVANALIQNPELVAILTDPEALPVIPSREGIEQEGRRLIELATSYTHALDRLRFLRQRWIVPIVVCDLSGMWEQTVVWQAISDLADALITLALEASWHEYAAGKGIDDECPLMVVGFGKLGGHELNYSSDVDLVYVVPSGISEEMEKHAGRVCEMLNRALSEPMGRGSLYRVDLRLRPFGGAGPIIQTSRAVEAYYRSHAELWESQALLRSRPICGPAELRESWEAMRDTQCFGSRLSTASVEQLLHMRERVEQHAEDEDLKRGRGGIRDIEFLTQILQLATGHEHPETRVLETPVALAQLSQVKALPGTVAEELTGHYTFLRKLEHRIQLFHDQQTHTVPPQEEARKQLARLMGFGSWVELDGELTIRRMNVRSIYQTILPPLAGVDDYRSKSLAQLGQFASDGAKWIDALPESEAFYVSLSENRDSIDRIRECLHGAPALTRYFASSMPLMEELMSGEIDEEFDAGDSIARLPANVPLETLAAKIRHIWVICAYQWSRNPEFALGERLAAIYSATLRHMMNRLYVQFDLLAMGSYAVMETALGSDLDVVFLVEDPDQRPQAEQHAQDLLSMADFLARHGAPIKIDLRLRPEGGKGLLVRSYDGFEAYELEAMEMWERFALGQSRLVEGNPKAESLAMKAAYAIPLTPEHLEELMHIKRRIESERLSPKYAKRHVKLGHGGLMDIEWMVHLNELRYPTAAQAGKNLLFDDRIRALARAKLINAIEMDQLLAARVHLRTLRDRLYLLGMTPDIVPENPDKLDRLAEFFGVGNGNEFLKEHENLVESVRTIYMESLERLRAKA
ncbi:MAG: hypothetical protein KF784_13690 [Fimbriimonadaceae bacterium]|nr:hypothetical protein [Fimbriimonadaceae bacterium]